MSFTVFDEGVTRSGFVAGVEGLAPYGIHVDAVLGVSQTGVVSARLDASYDLMLSQKLIAQPYLEAMAVSQNDPAIQLGSGLSRFEVTITNRGRAAAWLDVRYRTKYTDATGREITSREGVIKRIIQPGATLADLEIADDFAPDGATSAFFRIVTAERCIPERGRDSFPGK